LIDHTSWLIDKFPEFHNGRNIELLYYIKSAESQTSHVRFIVGLICTVVIVLVVVLASDLFIKLTSESIDHAIIFGVSIGLSFSMFGWVQKRIEKNIVKRKITELIESDA